MKGLKVVMVGAILGLIFLTKNSQAQDNQLIFRIQERYRRLQEPPDPRIQELVSEYVKSPLLSHPLSYLWGTKGIPAILDMVELVSSSRSSSDSVSSLVSELSSEQSVRETLSKGLDVEVLSKLSPSEIVAFAVGLITPIFNVSDACALQSRHYILTLFNLVDSMHENNGDNNGDNRTKGHKDDEGGFPPIFPVSWAVLMSDASGKVPRGILADVADYCELRGFYDSAEFCDHLPADDPRRHLVVPKGNAAAMGTFRGCINVNNDKELGTMDIRGAYCTLVVDGIEKPESEPESGSLFTPDVVAFFLRQTRPTWGQCVPSACSAEDMSNHMKIMYAALPAAVEVLGCQTKESEKDIRNIDEDTAYSIGLVVLTLALLTVSGTTADALAFFFNMETSTLPILYRVLVLFSLRTNGQTLLDSNWTADPALVVTGGLKVLSLWWIMWLNLFAFLNSFPLIIDRYHLNKIFEGQPTPPYYELISNGYVAVESFFFVSAVTLALPAFKLLATRQYRKTSLLFLEKLLKVSSVNVAVLLMAVYILPYLGSGPIWQWYMSKEIVEKCEEQWWANLLLVNNLQVVTGNVTKMCNPPSWWMAADMQLSLILCPVVVLLMSFFSTLINLLGWGALQMGITALMAVLVALFNLPASIVFRHNGDTDLDVYTDFHLTPWTHAQAFLVGILTAYILMKRPNLKINGLVAIVLWVVCLLAMLIVVFGLHPFHSDHIMADPNSVNLAVAILYQGGARLVWALCLAWIVIASAAGRGGYVGRMLSWGFFVSVSKFNFHAYLTHYLVFLAYFASLTTSIEASLPWMVFFYNGIVVVSYCFAFLVGLLWEQPTTRIVQSLCNQLNEKGHFHLEHTNTDNNNMVEVVDKRVNDTNDNVHTVKGSNGNSEAVQQA